MTTEVDLRYDAPTHRAQVIVSGGRPATRVTPIARSPSRRSADGRGSSVDWAGSSASLPRPRRGSSSRRRAAAGSRRTWARTHDRVRPVHLADRPRPRTGHPRRSTAVAPVRRGSMARQRRGRPAPRRPRPRRSPSRASQERSASRPNASTAPRRACWCSAAEDATNLAAAFLASGEPATGETATVEAHRDRSLAGTATLDLRTAECPTPHLATLAGPTETRLRYRVADPQAPPTPSSTASNNFPGAPRARLRLTQSSPGLTRLPAARSVLGTRALLDDTSASPRLARAPRPKARLAIQINPGELWG